MRTCRFSTLFAPLVLLLAVEIAPIPTGAQEIPLKHCDKLPVIEVAVGEQSVLFLVDTAATSFLNLETFAEGKSQDVAVTSWSGTLATSAKEVTLKEVVIGNTKFVRLKLPAVDLSAIGKACGRKIDGILGVDLLAKLGATIDLKKQTVHVTTLNEERAAELAAEMHSEMQHCLEAFSERYFHQEPAARLEIRESAFHTIGEAVWYEYDFTIEYAHGVLRGRGMAMCKKSEGRWRMASMHHSIMEMEHSTAAK